MKPAGTRGRGGAALPFLVGVLALLAAAALTSRAQSSEAARIDWREGAAGYAAAMTAASKDGRPVLVYFRTDWCPYCRELERLVLSAPPVLDELRTMSAVRVNPEAGEAEAALAETYGVSGYPGLFLHAQASASPRRVARTVRGPHGEPRLKTPEEFVQTLRELRIAAGTAPRRPAP